MLVGTEPTDATEQSRPDAEPPPPSRRPSAGLGAAVLLCAAAALAHVFLVFLHVAPANAVSRQFSRQVNAWVYPLFEQNWKLFAPDPESVNQRISARTAHTDAAGTVTVSGWFDLSAVDDEAVRHSVFPSHTSQNMLRRAWSSYLESHGGDDVPHSERAVLLQEYLRDIAADRVAAHRHGAFESVQLRVVTEQIAPPGATGTPRAAAKGPSAADTRYLPWWTVISHDND